MRILIRHALPEPLELPMGYHHILQGIIYKSLGNFPEFSSSLHNIGYEFGKRSFRMFSFSTLTGNYRIQDNRIIFQDEVSFQVTSPNVYMMQILVETLSANGITYGDQHYEDVEVFLSDATIESTEAVIRMLSPISVYETDPETRQTRFYAPDDPEFAQAVNTNFMRKYAAYYGVMPQSGVWIQPQKVSKRDKYVTRYKNFMITGWKGTYTIYGERKYLDFLLQTGLGSRNAQGFGMFEELTESNCQRH